MNSNTTCPHVAAATLTGAAVSLAGFYPLKEVVNRLPVGPGNRRLHPKVPVRWALQGAHGVKLRFIAAGRQKLTCDEWLVQFCDAVAREQQSTPATTTHSLAATRPARSPDRSRMAADAARRAKTAKILEDAGLEPAATAARRQRTNEGLSKHGLAPLPHRDGSLS